MFVVRLPHVFSLGWGQSTKVDLAAEQSEAIQARLRRQPMQGRRPRRRYRRGVRCRPCPVVARAGGLCGGAMRRLQPPALALAPHILWKRRPGGVATLHLPPARAASHAV